jgi:hypothetical protein
MLVALAWYWSLCRKRPEAAMLLAILPLVFAWRSLPSYFFCSIYPAFILMAAKARPAWIPVPQTGLLAQKPLAGTRGAAAQSRPAPVGMRAAISIAHFFLNMLPLRRFASPTLSSTIPGYAGHTIPRIASNKGPLHSSQPPSPLQSSWFSLPASWSEDEDDEPAVQRG